MLKYLLNKKAYEIHTGQKADVLFKTQILKAVDLDYNGLVALNLSETSEQKVFTWNKHGVSRILMEGTCKVFTMNKHLTDEAFEIGKAAAGY